MGNIFEKLDKAKFYCNKCLKNGFITALKIDEVDNNYLKLPNCEHKNFRPFYKILWNEEKQK